MVEIEISAMHLSQEKGNATIMSGYFWDEWPTDSRADDLPMINSVAWPIGEHKYII